jgi:hypothetical protein
MRAIWKLAWCLKVRTVEPEETTIGRQQLGKHIGTQSERLAISTDVKEASLLEAMAGR